MKAGGKVRPHRAQTSPEPECVVCGVSAINITPQCLSGPHNSLHYRLPYRQYSMGAAFSLREVPHNDASGKNSEHKYNLYSQRLNFNIYKEILPFSHIPPTSSLSFGQSRTLRPEKVNVVSRS